MHTSGIGYGPGAITPGVPLVARSPEETGRSGIEESEEVWAVNGSIV